MFSQQQPMRNMRQPGPPNRPAPNQRMMGGRPPAMRQPSFSGQQQGFQPPRQSFPQQPGIESRNGLGGGLKGMLSKFLPGAGGTGAPGAAAGGGSGLQGIQNLANPASLSSMLSNVQKVLGMAQQVTPMIQQYGPLVRNLPAMMKLYSQLSSNDDETEEADGKEDETNETDIPDETETVKKTSPVPAEPKAKSAPAPASKKKEVSPSPVSAPVKRTSGSSKPRLYI
ncbi:VrrA/YqfQ family protein [Bacillus atrophaeus]|uniref:VrrA/YqfQ family protein n=1 Tax=Bacillus atrophaeus TaxID=1452 RepID=UPI002DC033D9|nr:VrrA/YqfQ family protein [Bacillus atrophaeus]MEC2307191.1 VrrA/YqfQ family protein [Bacillus atrophaeus]